jgi:hypothetical protein
MQNDDEKAAHPRDVDACTNNELKRGPTPARFRDEGAETSESEPEGGEVDGTGCGDVEMMAGDDSSESSDSEPEFELEKEM